MVIQENSTTVRPATAKDVKDWVGVKVDDRSLKSPEAPSLSSFAPKPLSLSAVEVPMEGADSGKNPLLGSDALFNEVLARQAAWRERNLGRVSPGLDMASLDVVDYSPSADGANRDTIPLVVGDFVYPHVGINGRVEQPTRVRMVQVGHFDENNMLYTNSGVPIPDTLLLTLDEEDKISKYGGVLRKGYIDPKRFQKNGDIDPRPVSRLIKKIIAGLLTRSEAEYLTTPAEKIGIWLPVENLSQHYPGFYQALKKH